MLGWTLLRGTFGGAGVHQSVSGAAAGSGSHVPPSCRPALVLGDSTGVRLPAAAVLSGLVQCE